MKKICFLIIIILIPFSVTGCADQIIVDKTGFILLYGLELSPPNDIISTYAYPVIGAIEKNQIEVISVTSINSRDAREKARRKASLSIKGGKTQELLFSDEIARKGIHPLMEIFERDPTNPSLAYVVVVEGSPKELIEEINKVKERTTSPTYVRQLLEQNMEISRIPETRIYNFDVDYFADGIDPITPLVKLDGDGVLICGAALFSDDKMVGKIDTDQNVLLEAMMGKMYPTEFTFRDQALIDNENKVGDTFKKQGLVMYLSKVDNKIKINIINNVPYVDITLNFTGNISEYMWDDLAEENEAKKIEDILSNELNRKINDLLKYIQEVGSDPIGIGNIIRSKYNDYWKKNKWSEVYKNTKFNVKTNVKYVLNGTIK